MNKQERSSSSAAFKLTTGALDSSSGRLITSISRSRKRKRRQQQVCQSARRDDSIIYALSIILPVSSVMALYLTIIASIVCTATAFQYHSFQTTFQLEHSHSRMFLSSSSSLLTTATCRRKSKSSELSMVLQQPHNIKTPLSSFGQSLHEILLPDPSQKQNSNLNPQTQQKGSTPPPPLYITIGPPCSGKTKAIQEQLYEDGYTDPNHIIAANDIALDEQQDVYYRIPLEAFLFPSTQLNNTLGETVLTSGITIRNRLLNPPTTLLDFTDMELRNIILRIAGRITKEQFTNRTLQQVEKQNEQYQNNYNSKYRQYRSQRRLDVAYDLIYAVEQISIQAIGEVLISMHQPTTTTSTTIQPISNDIDGEQDHDDDLPYDHVEEETEEESSTLDLSKMINATTAQLLPARKLIKTSYVDLFVPDAIFHGGLDQAETKLQELLQTKDTDTGSLLPVIWGNTNTHPKEYAVALQAAQYTNRPVQFITYGISPLLPKVSRSELFQRMITKFRNTGRFIPAGAIDAALGRIEILLESAEKERLRLFGKKVDYHDKDEKRTLETDSEIQKQQQQQQQEHNSQRYNHEVNVALASLAGFVMDQDGYVTQIREPKMFGKRLYRTTRGNKWKPKRKTMDQEDQQGGK